MKNLFQNISKSTMTFKVPFNDFTSQDSCLYTSQIQACEDVISSGWWILGKKVEKFENEWAKVCTSSHCAGTANGLDAIEIGLRALGIQVGDEVITTSLTAYATVLAIQRCGAIPVFADINPRTGCLCPYDVEKCIGPRTRAIVVVHLYGRSADMTLFRDICNKHDLFLVEDCAQAHLAIHNEQSVGTFGHLATWSFYPTKNLGAIGDAGAITSNNSDLIATAKMLRNYGQKDRYYHEIAGMNSRLDELQASILLARLPFLREWTTRRRDVAHKYWIHINNKNINLLDPPSNQLEHVNHLFVIRVKCRDLLQKYLTKHGIQTLIHYPVPCHMQNAINQHRCSPSGLSATNNFAEECLSLPIHPALTDEQVNHVIQTCNEFDV